MLNFMLLVVAVGCSSVGVVLIASAIPKVLRKANAAMLGLTTDFSGEDSDQQVKAVGAMDIASATWAMQEKSRLEAALLNDELSGGRNTERTRQYYGDRAEAELDNQLHDRMHRRSRREILRQLKDELHEGRMVQYVSCRGGLRQARIVGYSAKKGKTFTARLQLMGGGNAIVRRHISRLVAA